MTFCTRLLVGFQLEIKGTSWIYLKATGHLGSDLKTLYTYSRGLERVSWHIRRLAYLLIINPTDPFIHSHYNAAPVEPRDR